MKYPIYLVFRREPTAKAERARQQLLVSSIAAVILGWTVLMMFGNSGA